MNPGTQPTKGWRWPVVAGVAIVLGAAIGWLWPSETAPPSETPLAPEARPAPSTPAPSIAAPENERGATQAPSLPEVGPLPTGPAARGRTPPVTAPTGGKSAPAPRTGAPPSRTAPGGAPEPELTQDPERWQADADRRARTWAESMAEASPTVRSQIVGGKMREREGLRARIAQLEADAARNPSSRQAARDLQEAKEDLYYLDRALEHLETFPERSP